MLRDGCPVCKSKDVAWVRKDLGPHPYYECWGCGLYYQLELKPKVYEAPHEAPGDSMGQSEKDVNRSLANWLFDRVGHPSPLTLDVGSKYPYLSHCLGERGAKAFAMDGIPAIKKFAEGLKVKAYQCDFEDWWRLGEHRPLFAHFSLITMVHMIEHLYYPLESCRAIKALLTPGGYFFVRCPSSDVPGIERDFTPGHYSIHPQIWSHKSLKCMADRVGLEVVYEAELEPGQRDVLFRRFLT